MWLPGRPLFRTVRSFLTSSRKMTSTIKPLTGVKVVELGGLAPVPHAGMVLADFGAQVTVVEKNDGADIVQQRLTRGKTITHADLKTKRGVEVVKGMLQESDVLLDPYRPGVLEKLGLDPVELLESNPKLIVCRLTGYGQSGALAQEAGHDINYVAITGLLPTIAGHYREPYWPPANLLADFAGGGLSAAFGVVAALFNRTKTGKGCIIDNSMVEGLSYLGSFITHYKDIDMLWNVPYASFSGDCPIYRTYKTKDGKYVAVGALEPKFNQNLFTVLGLEREISEMYEKPELIVKEMEAIFRTKTRDEWAALFEGKNACVTPVLDMHEAGDYPHNAQRGTFTQEGEKWIPNPAPKLYTAEQFKKINSKL